MTRALYAIAFPELPEHAQKWLADICKLYQNRATVRVDAHFTLVFGCDAVAPDEFTNHVAAIARAAAPIAFVCRRAVVHFEESIAAWYVFLIPEEGSAEILQLHDRLYSGVLSAHLRADLPYVPHITIAQGCTESEARALCARVESDEVELRGTLRAVVVGAVEGGSFQVHARLALGVNTTV